MSIRRTIKDTFTSIASRIRSWVAPKSTIVSLNFYRHKSFPIQNEFSSSISYYGNARQDFQTVARKIGNDSYTVKEEVVSRHQEAFVDGKYRKQISNLGTSEKTIFNFNEVMQILKTREDTYQKQGLAPSDRQASSALHFSKHKPSH